MNLIPLRAGPLSLVFDRENGAIRYVFAGPHEILRGINAPVRDAQWRTIRPAVTNLEITQPAAGFRVTFDARCRNDVIDFRWRGMITGHGDGTLVFDFEGEALREFARSRIGFCVLHPAEASGCSVIVEHTDGNRQIARLPSSIAPHQPFHDIRALTHEFAPGLRAEARLEGETFEMEDQRNWTDASFKTYCTPLALPRPIILQPGTRIRQSVTLRLLDSVPGAESPSTPPWITPAEVSLELGASSSAALPLIGTQWRGRATPEIIAALLPLRLAHLRIDLRLAGDGWREALREGVSAAQRLETSLEVAIFVSEGARAQLLQLRDTLGPIAPAPRIARWLVFHEGASSTPRECIEAWREIFAPTPFTAPVGGGATDNFTELNRGRAIAGFADFTVHACNPQVHAFDDRSLIETLAIQADTVTAARRLSGGKPAVVSPITLTPRIAFSSAAAGQPTQPGPPPFQFDQRLFTPFAAAWTLGSLAATAASGVASLTYFEAVGANGLVGMDGLPRPIYHLLHQLAQHAGARMLTARCSHPIALAALALERGGERGLFAAAFDDKTKHLRVTGAWGERKLSVGPLPVRSVFD